MSIGRAASGSRAIPTRSRARPARAKQVTPRAAPRRLPAPSFQTPPTESACGPRARATPSAVPAGTASGVPAGRRPAPAAATSPVAALCSSTGRPCSRRCYARRGGDSVTRGWWGRPACPEEAAPCDRRGAATFSRLAFVASVFATSCSSDPPSASPNVAPAPSCSPGAESSPACDDPAAATPCDPATFTSTCDGARPAICDAGTGKVQLLSPCANGEVCVVGTIRAACSPPGTVPCVSDGFRSSCDGATGLVRCDLSTGLTEVRRCPEGRCKSSGQGAACWPFEQEDCDPESTKPVCDGAERVVCNSYGVTARSTCPADTSCETFSGGGYCVSPGAVACDALNIPRGCADETHRYDGCASSAGFALMTSCQPGWVCVEDDPCLGSGSSCMQGACVDPTWTPCDDTQPVTCEGNARRACIGGLTELQPCGDGEECSIEGTTAWCLPAGLPLCDAAQPRVSCDGGDRLFCLGTPPRLLRDSCEAPLRCVLADGVVSCEP